MEQALKPWYRLFCKRPCFHDDYLETFNRPNVTLVDTLGEGIQGMTRKGVLARGKEYEVDVDVAEEESGSEEESEEEEAAAGTKRKAGVEGARACHYNRAIIYGESV